MQYKNMWLSRAKPPYVWKQFFEIWVFKVRGTISPTKLIRKKVFSLVWRFIYIILMEVS